MEERYQKKKNSGLHPVGRLDYDSSGLLLFSSDGSLTQRLLHPRHEVEKEYVATVEGMSWDGIEAKEDELREMLNKGVETTEGVHTAKLLGVEPLMMVQKKEEEAKEPSTKEQESVPLTNVRLIVQEGKYRMVRRMLANCGYPVIELKRIRHGEVTLNDLEVGQFRVATSEELKWIESLLV
uniref:Pseudouridine synthase RsuA/RluA-like domain-containing protein n=1 Tax=Ditylum brightwellii TaxID=49249 RepID=A0A7S2E814_9STRA